MAGFAGRRKAQRGMVGIRRSLVVLQVATRARGVVQRVVAIDVAVGALAWRHRVQPSQRESGRIVIKGGVSPVLRTVALVACLREIRSNVVWVRGALEIFQVATYAGGVVDRVVIVDVAIGALAWRDGVHPRQGEPGRVVIEGGVGPVLRAVALVARLWEIRGDVIGIRGALEVLQVAGYAGSAAQRVITIDVTIGALAWRNCVHSRQGESSRRVIERRVSPLGRVVTVLASGREPVVRYRTRRAGVILLMARVAGHAAQVVVVVDVAVGAFAGRHGMAAGQKESSGGVVKLRVQPVVRGVTGIATG